MANQSQKNAVRRLQELNDGSEITSAYGVGRYDISHTDPYELSAVINAGGVISVAPTVAGVVVNAGTPDYSVATFGGAGATFTTTVTFNNAVGGEDDTVTFALVNVGVGNTGSYTISAGGVVTGTTPTAGDTFDVQATSNFDGTTIGTLSVTVVA